MKLLNRINLNDIKNFLNNAVEEFESDNYQITLIKDDVNNKLICLVIYGTIYGKIEFYESEIYINDEIDYELSYDWCVYLSYIFGINYKKLFMATLKEKYGPNSFVYIPGGIPQDLPILETINTIKERALEKELQEVDDLFAILNSEEYKWKNFPRKALVKRRK